MCSFVSASFYLAHVAHSYICIMARRGVVGGEIVAKLRANELSNFALSAMQQGLPMTNLKTILRDAASDGLITDEQSAPLETYLAGKGVGVVEPRLAVTVSDDPYGLDTAAEPENPAFESEAPRFIRGFHDILITIGIVVALIGASGLGSVFLLLPLTILLAEILVRRQRLALPAVALTIAFILSISAILQAFVEPLAPDTASEAFFVLIFVAPYPLLLAGFHWRYRVPLSLSLCIASIVALIVALIITSLGQVLSVTDMVESHRLLTLSILFAAAISLFTVAMMFDLKDPVRQTRRSDVAFWLHLLTAPFLLSTTLAFFYVGEISGLGFGITGEAGVGQAVLTILVVACFMAIGVIIDRRAFVTSGLLSMGYAIYAIFESANIQVGSFVFVTLFLVGVLVLTIGVGWAWFRRQIFKLLPEAMKAKLPPLR